MTAIAETVPAVTPIGVGIDTARNGHRVNFMNEEKVLVAKPVTVTEDERGYRELHERLAGLARQFPNVFFHVHIDAAGQYARNLEVFLRAQDFPMRISIGEPKRNKDYHKAMFPKRTCDDTESRAMARFAIVEKPPETPPVPDGFYVLREIVSRLQGTVKDSTRQTNRLHNLLARVFPEFTGILDNLHNVSTLKLLKKYPTPQRLAAARLATIQDIPYLRDEKAAAVHEAAKHSIGSLRGELAEKLVGEIVDDLDAALETENRLCALLETAVAALPRSGHVQVATIPGIGPATAAVLVAKIVDIGRFPEPENLVGYFGVFPEECSSGVTRGGQPLPPGTMVMSKKGCDIVRRYLWNAAQVAIKDNPAVRALYARLRQNGKRHDVAIGHCMRKLLHLAHAVWSADQPFDPNHHDWEKQTADQAPPSPDSLGGSLSAPEVAALADQLATDSAAPVADSDPPTKTAASHKKVEHVPPQEVVNAANHNLSPPAEPVKRAKPKSRSVDYKFLREQITIERILQHLGLRTDLRPSGPELRGPCPLHDREKRKRTFSANVHKNNFRCFDPQCHQAGNALDFWAAYHNLTIHQAALSLAETFQLQLTRNREEEPVAPDKKQAVNPQQTPIRPGVITPNAP